jgi:hypothetical protein
MRPDKEGRFWFLSSKHRVSAVINTTCAYFPKEDIHTVSWIMKIKCRKMDALTVYGARNRLMTYIKRERYCNKNERLGWIIRLVY